MKNRFYVPTTSLQQHHQNDLLVSQSNVLALFSVNVFVPLGFVCHSVSSSYSTMRMYMYFQLKYIVNVAVKTKGRLLTNKTTNSIRDI